MDQDLCILCIGTGSTSSDSVMHLDTVTSSGWSPFSKDFAGHAMGAAWLSHVPNDSGRKKMWMTLN